MLNVNDDMEELMRRAAENYPLKADANGFDKVLEGIRSFSNDGEPKEPKSNKKRLLWLLMLLPFTFICNKYYKNNGGDVAIKPLVDIERSKTNNSITATQRTSEFNKVKLPVSNQPGNKVGGEHSGGSSMKAQNKPATEFGKTELVGENEALVSTKTNRTQKQHVANKNQALVAVVQGSNRSFQKINERTKAIDAKGQHIVIVPNKNDAASTENRTQPGTETGIVYQDPVLQDDPTLREVYKDEVKHLELSMIADTSNQKKISPSTSTTSISGDKKARNKKVYAALLGGPDVSNVKGSSVSKVGYSFGFIAGYRAGKNINIETGLMWSKRFYKSEGKYFNTKKLPIPAYVKIIELDGFCQMYELPIGVTYEFKPGKKNTWFSALGFSTYFMKNEDYEYKYLSYGQQNTRYVKYDNSVNNWFSILNVSVGLNKKIAKNALLRVQPYIKIPLKGIGIGSLPVSGGGLYAGVVKNIF